MNNVIIDGTDLLEEYGLILTRNSEFGEPEPVTTFLSVPGRLLGDIDISEALSGDVPYSKRIHRLVFVVEGYNYDDLNRLKNDLYKRFHGKRFSYTLPIDPGYTYIGRFLLSDFYIALNGACVSFDVTADPYKSGGMISVTVNAAAGALVDLEAGRGKVRPVFYSKMPLEVICGDIRESIPPGSHSVDGLYVSSSNKTVYINSGSPIGTTPWSSIEGFPWSEYENKIWAKAEFKDSGSIPEIPDYNVTITYEIKEL